MVEPAPFPPGATEPHVVRVLDVTKFYAAVSGGVKTYLDAKMADFAGRPVSHSLVIPCETDAEEMIGRTRVHRVRGPVVPVSPRYRFLTDEAALRRIVMLERPHVIEVGSPFLVPVLVRRATRGLGIRTVGFYHSDLVRTYAEPYVRHRIAAPARMVLRSAARELIKRVYRRFDVTVAASQAVAAELRSLGIRDVRCVPLGVDLDLFAPVDDGGALRRRLWVPDGVPIALYAGRLCSEKRLDVLVEAHASIPEPQRPFLAMVGDGRLRTWLMERSGRQRRLAILPFVADRAELALLYGGADFYMAPGPGETFGLSIAEAMACGLPVVAVASGGAPDRIDQSGCGRLYAHGDAQSCASAIQAMSGMLGPRLGAAARRHAERAFSWRTTFDALCDIYAELVASPGAVRDTGPVATMPE
jgi:alpha-1,6-mannosyltransferase